MIITFFLSSVQRPGQVKITDFGLAKLLDYNEEEFHASGGKVEYMLSANVMEVLKTYLWSVDLSSIWHVANSEHFIDVSDAY